MVKKLLKHEFVYYFRIFGMFLPIVVVIGIMTRVFRLFDDNNVITQIAIGSSYSMLVAATVALISLSVIVSVVRFYKNMYSAEGYLTFTLPVTNAEHIFVKILLATVCQIVCFLTVFLSWCIALSGEILNDVGDGVAEAVKDLADLIGSASVIGYVIEFTLLAVVSVVANMLLYYACITVGQMAKKNRVLAAVGAYFAYYVATRIISTVVSVILMVIELDVRIGVIDLIQGNIPEIVHLYLWCVIVQNVLLGVAFWIVTQYIMTKKLNLE